MGVRQECQLGQGPESGPSTPTSRAGRAGPGKGAWNLRPVKGVETGGRQPGVHSLLSQSGKGAGTGCLSPLSMGKVMRAGHL